MTMLHAFLNDMAQRVLSVNRLQPRNDVFTCVSRLGLAHEAPVLDFGCGTGLFAPTLAKKCRLAYTGYDIDEKYLGYAKTIYPFGAFSTSRSFVEASGPYDLVMANCCFHHIADESAQDEMAFIKRVLKPGGTFLFIDILKKEHDPSRLHRWFMTLEEGKFVRLESQYIRLVSGKFLINRMETRRSVLFSLPWKSCPIHNDLIFLECEARR